MDKCVLTERNKTAKIEEACVRGFVVKGVSQLLYKTSKKANLPFLFSFLVKLILGCCWLMYSKNSKACF